MTTMKPPSIKTGDFEFKLDFDEISGDVAEKARNELRENPDTRQEAIVALRDLLREEKNLTIPLDDDMFLVRFLRPCKFYPESALELVKRYYDFKVKHHKHYKGLVPSKEKNIFENNILTVFPNRDQEGRRVLLLELGTKWKTGKVSLDEVFKGCVLLLEAALLEPKTQVNGALVIFDMEGLSLSQVWQFTPPFAKRIVDWLQDAVPIRVKAIHVVNQPYIFNMVFNLFKPFLREKLRSRMYFHGTDRDSLYKHMDPKCLPKAYGGTMELPRIDGMKWHELLMQLEDYYQKINTYGIKDGKSK